MTITPTNRVARALFAGAAIALGAPSASAQSVTDVLTFLVTNQSVATGSVERDREAAQATSVTISRALAANLATLPVTSSSGSFVYRLNPELGTVERATQSFGPFFTERAQAAGRGQAAFGLTLQQLHFTSLDGRSLRDGSLITTANRFTDEAAPFDVDQFDAEHRRERGHALWQRGGDGSTGCRRRRAAGCTLARWIAHQHLSRPRVHPGDG